MQSTKLAADMSVDNVATMFERVGKELGTVTVLVNDACGGWVSP